MAVTILDGAAGSDQNIPGTQTIAATADGTLWTMFHDESGTAGWRFFYSTDNGANWSENTSLKVETNADQGVFAINAVRDIAVCRLQNEKTLSIVGLTTSSTTWVEATTEGQVWGACTGLVVFDKPNSTNFYVAGYLWSSFFSRDTMTIGEYTAAGAYVSNPSQPVGTGGGNQYSGAVDFHHTGDGHQVQGETPHLYLSYIDSSFSNRLYFQKYVYDNGAWTANSARILNSSDFGASSRASCVFDGTRAIVAGERGNDVYLYERDADDTTTTPFDGATGNAEFPATTAVGEVRLSHQEDTGFTVWVMDTTNFDIDYAVYDRDGDSWSSLTELENYATGLDPDGFSVMRSLNASSYAAGMWLVNDGTGFDIDTNSLSFGPFTRSLTASGSITTGGSAAIHIPDRPTIISATTGSCSYLTLPTFDYPAHSAGDMVVFIHEGQNEVNITPTGPNGETLVQAVSVLGQSSYRMQAFYWIATANTSAGTYTAGTSYTGSGYACLVFEADSFDADAPFPNAVGQAVYLSTSPPFASFDASAAGMPYIAYGSLDTQGTLTWPSGYIEVVQRTPAFGMAVAEADETVETDVTVAPTGMTGGTGGYGHTLTLLVASTPLEHKSATGSASIALSASGTVSTVSTVGTSSLVLAASATVVASGPDVDGSGSFALAASATVVKTDSGGPWQDFTDGVTSSTGATVTGLTPGTDYEFRVAAVNDIDQGPWSNVATTTT